MDLLAFERKLDQTIMRKRLDIQEALKRPIKVYFSQADHRCSMLPLTGHLRVMSVSEELVRTNVYILQIAAYFPLIFCTTLYLFR